MFKRLYLVAALFFIPGCAAVTHFSNGNASGYWQLQREECVPYARRVSGIQLHGDAYTWWNSAAGVYARGQVPAPGAVLVLAKTNKLTRGHLSVVSGINGPREITVSHTNWGDGFVSRRITYESVRVQDVSPLNDWTSVRFWSNAGHVFGAPYAAKGFIYNRRQ